MTKYLCRILKRFCQYHLHQHSWIKKNISLLLDLCDIIIDATDSSETKQEIHSFCSTTKKPWILSSAQGVEIMVVSNPNQKSYFKAIRTFNLKFDPFIDVRLYSVQLFH